jgi:hypothetical protein
MVWQQAVTGEEEDEGEQDGKPQKETCWYCGYPTDGGMFCSETCEHSYDWREFEEDQRKRRRPRRPS